MLSNINYFLKTNKHLLFLFYFLLLPFGSVYVIYCILLLLVSVLSLRIFKDSVASNYYVYLFMLVWVPMLISLIVAINFDKSFIKTLSVFPFLFVGLYLTSGLSIKKIYTAMFIIVVATGFWCIDFFIYHYKFIELEHALLWRWSFSIDNIHYIPILGQILSVLLPIIFEAIRKYSQTRIKASMSLIFAVIYITTIILSGNRNAVLMMLLSLFTWSIYAGIKCGYFKNFPKIVFSIILVAVVFFSTLLSFSTTRLVSLSEIQSTDLQTIDKLSSHRLPLWEAAYNMAKDNWINGIGPRGYRYGYEEYRPEVGKYEIEYNEGMTHPHFALLEVFLETGIIGLLSLFFLFWLILKEILKANEEIQLLLVPWFIALLTAIIPNIGKAFYSSYWLTFIIFLLIGIASIVNISKKIKTAEF
jgi:O-antigen ligase